MNLPAVLATLTRDEARAAYDALAQWADNERNALEETDETSPADPVHVARVALVEGVVARLEAELVTLAASPEVSP